MRLILILFFTGYFVATTAAQSIERIEPPFWWRDMNDPVVQLMVYGEDLANTRVELAGNAARLVGTHTLTSPNYIFVDLEVAEGTEEASVALKFRFEDGREESVDYVLRKRRPGSAMRQGFNSADVMYLITPDRFVNGNLENDSVTGMREGFDRTKDFGRHGGDIAGIRQHLDYIKDMGFTAIWLNPVLENDQDKWSYHGYATTDYYKVDPRFGTNEEYVELSEVAANMGIKMIMDIIVNHCGSFHWWMDDPPSGDWIHHYDSTVYTNHKKSTLLDPYVAEADRSRMVKGWFVDAMPDLNQNNPFLSKYLIQNSIWWIEFADLAGIRQDTYSYPYRNFMTDWTCAIMNEYPHFNIVGEEWVEDPVIISYWQRGKQNQDGYTSCLPSLMDFPLTASLHRALIESDGNQSGFNRLYETLANDHLYADPQALVVFPDNHDMSRILTQVKEDVDLYKMAIAYTLFIRGTPQLYYGTEVLMSNEGTDSHGVIRSDLPGGWPGDSVNVFTGEGLTDQQKEAMDFVKTLLTWRRDKSVIHNGDILHFAPENQTYVLFRHDDSDTVMLIMHKGEEAHEMDMSRFKEGIGSNTRGRDVISGNEISLTGRVVIPPRSVLLLDLE